MCALSESDIKINSFTSGFFLICQKKIWSKNDQNVHKIPAWHAFKMKTFFSYFNLDNSKKKNYSIWIRNDQNN